MTKARKASGKLTISLTVRNGSHAVSNRYSVEIEGLSPEDITEPEDFFREVQSAIDAAKDSLKEKIPG